MSRDSTPPLPGLEPPSSPPLLPTASTSRKKRARSQSLHEHHHANALSHHPSSDPFVFSSDDAPEDVENYNSPARKKRQYAGPWFAHGHQPKSERTTPAKADFSRNQDSGVWLPSDSSDDSLIERLAAASTGPSLFGQVPRPCAPSEPDENPLPVARRVHVPEPRSTEHAVAHAKVHECVEEGNERVDLSALQLRSMSDDLLEPLAHLIRHPKIGPEVPSEEAYEPFTPSLQLYLSSNQLRSLPAAIWELENLGVLSLRINKLTDLSPAISNLKNLKELNLAGNRLRWLPWELLRLVPPNGNLTRLSISPNPFVKGLRAYRGFDIPADPVKMQQAVDEMKALFEDDECENGDEKEQLAWSLRLHESLLQKMREEAASSQTADGDSLSQVPFKPPAWKQEPVFLASTSVARMEFDGRLQSGSPQKPSSTSYHVTSFPVPFVGHTPADDIPASSSRVPSLLELSLRSASRAVPNADLLRDLLPHDTPDPVLRALDDAIKAQQNGGQQCSVCNKKYIIPRAEWIEYWHYVPDSLFCSGDDAFLPFLRRACSLGCAASVKAGEI
ncbi:leucine rich repeat domain protein [Diplodia corticola]|uniref:Leucine rich repeat domain protein n=1 Tax=Diplodia corticola TaxID=236234 RepID=A0A1J9R353_9PEZI|nr:leucine rich repeat domain protein [Diplodia corticola]OJD35040.1 leucine rich repeat domain protein [Diplodia corticola]